MTLEQKAKAYDKALKVIKGNLDALNEFTGTGSEAVNIQSIKNCFYKAFPELKEKESEDERIRKELLAVINDLVLPDEQKTRFNAWLEKQKDQKKPTLDDPDLYGDWDNDLLEEIHSWLGHLDGKYTPYTIDDIKLTARHFVEWQKQKEQKPAEYLSKEKVFAIMNKLTSLSFCVPLGSDEEKKIHEITCDVSSLLDYPIEKQKPVEFDEYKIIKKHITEDMLSSEVNKRLTECGWYVTDKKPVEWSEENEKDTAHIIRILDDCYAYGKHDLSKTDHENLVNKLKSLRPQPHWKPSEKQMDFLKDIINEYKYLARPKVVAILQSLYNNLKEL